MKKILLTLVIMFTTLILFACGMNVAKPTLTLEVDEVEINVGDTYEIDAILENTTAEIIYTVVEGEELISIEENVVTALQEGTAKIEITVKGYPKLNAVLTIEIVPVEEVKPEIVLKESSVELEVGEEYAISADAGEHTLVYVVKAEYDEIVSVEGNVVTALKPGTAEIIIDFADVSTNIHQKIFTVVVKEAVVVVPELVVEPKEITLTNEVKQYTINATVNNVEANIIFAVIEGNEVVKIDNNVVMALSSGNATVRVSVEGYPDVYVDIIINVEIVDDTEAPVIEVNEDSKELKLNWNKEATTEFLMTGISAIDDVDGDITKSVKVSHEINNRKYGSYVVKYEVKDNAGNTATLERTVKVVWDYAVQFIGHQGSYYGVANTEEAFLYAAEVLQYQALETDVKQTKDGIFVCCHDDTFGGKTIANTNWADLKDVVVESSRTAGYPSQYGEMPGTGKYSSKICTLERYLEICKEYGIYAVVELKGSPGISNSDQSRMPALMELIEKVGMLDQTIFLASAYNCLIWVKQNGYDYIPCQYLVDSFASETVYERCVTYGLDVSGCVTYGNGQTQNTPEWVARYQEAGLKVSTYTFTQYSDYSDVQKWINIGVDFVTVDWQSMHKLTLPDNNDITYYTVKFYDHNNNLLKETQVREGRTASSPKAPEREGYEFKGWSESITNVTSDMEVTAEYELVEYSITYDSNLYVVTKSSWATKQDFVSDFYNDLFDWFVANYTHIAGASYNNGKYTLKINSTEYGSATISSAQDIKDLYVYTFERTFATLIYKPIEGTNSHDYVPEIDENYFLNTEPYRTKYIECNEYFLKAMEQNPDYANYSFTYQQASNNRVQIFFRFHQWCNGTNISVFNKYPQKNMIKYLVGVNVTLPTDHVTYTIEDEFTLSSPVASIQFLGWYLDHDATSEQVIKIEKGTTGDIILYAKWEEVEMPDVYSKVNYELDGGQNHESNPTEYLEGTSTMLYPASKPGYVFLGWSKVKGSNSYITSINELTSGEITLYANYKYAVYSISYDLQNGSWGNKAEFTGSPVTSIATTAKSGFWAGEYANHIFLNHASSDPAATWSFRVGIGYDDQMGIYSVINIADNVASFSEEGVEYVITISSSYSKYGDTSAFRKAVAIGQGVKVTGDLDSGIATIEFYDSSSISGGTVENYVDEYTIATLPTLLPTPKMEGKVFIGWALSADSTETFTSLPAGTMGDVTLYAIYGDNQ